jgi:nucleotide-binding universal stress UspA family protein
MVMKIVVCYDGSESSERALGKAVETFDHFTPVFVLATVGDLGHGADVEDAFATEEVEHELKDKAIEAGESIGEDGRRNVDLVFAIGEPRETLTEIVKRQAPDYVVIGKRELSTVGKIEERILGSVSDYLIHHTDVPILICN